MSRTLRFLILVALTVAPLGRALGQRFEGVIRQRTITVEQGALDNLLYGDEDEPDVEDESEEAYTRRMTERLFSIPLDQLIAAAREEGEVSEGTIHVKGSRIRAAMSSDGGDAGWTVLDLDAGTVTMVNDAGRYFVRWTMTELERQMQTLGVPQQAEERGPEGPAPEVRALGRTETVGGKSCRGFDVMLEEGEIVRGWVTDAYPGLQEALKAYGERAQRMFGDAEHSTWSAEDLLFERGFPMRVQRVYGGFGMFSSYEIEEVLSVDASSVPDAMFAVPTGYAEKSLKELWDRQ